MPPPSQYKNQQHQCHCRNCNCRGCSLSWCSSGFSISSSETPDRGYASISSVAHAMVQERLDQMINERREARRRRRRDEGSKFVVMVAMEKPSYDPRQDFRDSIVEMIESNRIMRPGDLRRLLECYLSMNSDECRGVILDVFHNVCSDIFL